MGACIQGAHCHCSTAPQRLIALLDSRHDCMVRITRSARTSCGAHKRHSTIDCCTAFSPPQLTTSAPPATCALTVCRCELLIPRPVGTRTRTHARAIRSRAHTDRWYERACERESERETACASLCVYERGGGEGHTGRR